MPSQAFPTFEAYAAQMNPVVVGLSRRYARRPHPFLGEDDLLQEALVGLWQVWSNHKKKPRLDICRIGSRAAHNKLNDVWSRASSRGQADTSVISLDADVGEDEPSLLSESLSAEDVDEMTVAFATREIESLLSSVDRAVLRQLLTPSVKTLAVTRALLKEKQLLYHRRRFSVEIISQSLRLSEEEVRESWSRIRHVTREWLNGTLLNTHPIVKVKEDIAPMETIKTPGDLPDADALGLGTPSTGGKKPASKPAAKKKAPAAATKPAPKPAVKAQEKKKSAPKTKAKPAAKKKPATKPSAPKKDKVQKVPKSQALKVGTKVKYKGGSRCKWLKAGAVGEVKHHYGDSTLRYGLKFGEKLTVLAAHYVEKV